MEPLVALTLAGLALGAYLLGSVPFGIIVARAMGLGDPRQIGSGNIGATNVLRTGNKPLAAATLDEVWPRQRDFGPYYWVDEAALPFDRRRHGTIIGMGAGALVVESEDVVDEILDADVAADITLAAGHAQYGRGSRKVRVRLDARTGRDDFLEDLLWFRVSLLSVGRNRHSARKCECGDRCKTEFAERPTRTRLGT